MLTVVLHFAPFLIVLRLMHVKALVYVTGPTVRYTYRCLVLFIVEIFVLLITFAEE